MLNLESGDRIELFYEDAPATAIRATVGRLLSDREEGTKIAFSGDPSIFQERLNSRQAVRRK